MDKMHIYENKINDAIRRNDNLGNELAKIVFSAYWDGYQKGYKYATKEATQEIHKNYKPID